MMKQTIENITTLHLQVVNINWEVMIVVLCFLFFEKNLYLSIQGSFIACLKSLENAKIKKKFKTLEST